MHENDDERKISLDFDLKFKIMVIGETKVGKTSVIKRYTNDKFGGVYLTTIGVDFQDKVIQIEEQKIRLQIWDTAGQERFRNITKNYFNSSNGFLLIYDITDKASLEHLNFWVAQINLNAPEKTKCILVGNKCDLEESRQVSKEEGKNYAEKNKIKFFETSAKNGTNIKEVFEYIAKEIYNQQKMELRTVAGSQVLDKSKIVKKKKKCC